MEPLQEDLIPGFLTSTRLSPVPDDRGWIELEPPEGPCLRLCPACAGNGGREVPAPDQNSRKNASFQPFPGIESLRRPSSPGKPVEEGLP